ncbi:MAG: type II toxin-antitoxin system RelE/ParE family toxin [Thermodesulfobacteriota bacterium]
MSYHILLNRQARKELQRIDRTTEKRINERLEKLSRDPFSTRLSNPLTTISGVRYSRVGDWRIIYRIDESKAALEVLAIRPRGKGYNDL